MNENEELKNDSITLGAIGGVIALGLKILATFLGFLNQIVLARILGAGSLGEVILAITLVRIVVQIAKFGMEETMMKFVPLYIKSDDDAGLKGSIYFSLRFCFLLSLFFVGLLLVLSRVVAINIFHSEGLLKLLPFVIFAIPAWTVRDVIAGILKGYKDALRALLPESLISPFFRLIIFLILIIKGASPLYAIVAFVSGELLAVLLSIRFLLRRLQIIGSVNQRSDKRKLFEVAYTIIFTSMSVLFYTQTDIWIIGMFESTDIVGIYGIVAKLALLVYFPMLTFSTIIPSLISSMHATGNQLELKNIVRESTRWILSMAIPTILLLLLEGKFILKYIYGNEFEAGYMVLVILVIGQLIKAASGLVGFILQMTGGHRIYMKINIFWGIMNIILNLILVPHFGMLGAAVATAFCLSGVDITGIYVIYRRLSITTLARGLKFDIIFLLVVVVFYVFVEYNNFYQGVHFLFVIAVLVYLWKSIRGNDIPLRLLYNRFFKTG